LDEATVQTRGEKTGFMVDQTQPSVIPQTDYSTKKQAGRCRRFGFGLTLDCPLLAVDSTGRACAARHVYEGRSGVSTDLEKIQIPV